MLVEYIPFTEATEGEQLDFLLNPTEYNAILLLAKLCSGACINDGRRVWWRIVDSPYDWCNGWSAHTTKDSYDAFRYIASKLCDGVQTIWMRYKNQIDGLFRGSGHYNKVIGLLYNDSRQLRRIHREVLRLRSDPTFRYVQPEDTIASGSLPIYRRRKPI